MNYTHYQCTPALVMGMRGQVGRGFARVPGGSQVVKHLSSVMHWAPGSLGSQAWQGFVPGGGSTMHLKAGGGGGGATQVLLQNCKLVAFGSVAAQG